MDKNTKFLMVVMVILAIVTLVFVIYISSQDSIIRQKEDPKEIIKEITENQEVESTKLKLQSQNTNPQKKRLMIF